MSPLLLILEVVAFAFALWLGLYLIARDAGKPSLLLAGLGLAAYALALAVDLFGFDASALALMRVHRVLLLVPALLWTGAALHLLPDETRGRDPLIRVWSYGLLPALGLLLLMSAASDLALEVVDGTLRANAGYTILGAVIVAPLALAMILTWRARTARLRAQLWVMLLFFGLGTGLVLLPSGLIPRGWILAAIGVDLELLGYIIAAWDAFEEGESLLPDLVRSGIGALAAAGVFGGLIGGAMIASLGVTPATLILLVTSITVAVVGQVFGASIEAALDRVVFARLPEMRRARADLREAARMLPRRTEAADLAEMDDLEFARLTRRALSHFGDLPRLSASPLTHLPTIDARLAEQGRAGSTLARAAALKTLLAESIGRLKPQGGDDFGTTDEWRFYNALYFPYVAGLRPYSRRTLHDDIDPAAEQALDWFQTQVPERTLYNWQNAAAALVAQDLRERS